jgi:DeoR/GlpR family transcriptional regulator of sugar metabolism
VVTDAGLRHESAADRREEILSTLRTTGFLPIADLARQLGVSQMTIRRDLHMLESTGVVRIFHGGAGLAPSAVRGSVFLDEDAAACQRVGARAAGLVEAADTIVIDAGPIAYALAQAIGNEFSGCVITHSLPVLQHFDLCATAARTVALGGELLPDRHAFVGPTAEVAVAGLRARTFFLTPAAVDARGMYARSAAEATLQRRLLEIADRVVLLATGQTFSSSAPARVACLDRLTAVVADGRPPAEVAAALRRLGVVPHIVGT